MINNYHKNAEKVVLFIAVTAICLLFINVLFTGELTTSISFETKVIVFNTIASVGIVFGLLALSKNGLEIDKMDILLMLFVGFVIGNYILKINSFNNSLYAVVLSAIMALIIKQLLVRYKDSFSLYFIITVSFLVVGLIESALGVLQLFDVIGKIDKFITGSFFNSGIFAIFTTAILAFSLANYSVNQSLNKEDQVIKTLCTLNIVFGVIILPSTHSRSSWIAILLTLLFILFIRYKENIKGLRKYRLALMSVLFLMIVATSLFLYQYKKDSADGRLIIWKTGLIAAKSNPLTGLGFDQIQHKFGDYQAIYFKANQEEGIRFSDKVEYAFNDFLHILIENGFVGFSLFLVLLILIYTKLPKEELHNPYLIGALAGSVSLLICSAFSYPFEMISIRFLFFFFLALLMSFIEMKSFKLNKRVTWVIVLLGVVFSGIVLWQQRNVYLSKKHLVTAQRQIYMQDFQSALENYQMALNFTPGQRSILPAYGMALLKLKRHEESVDVLIDADKYISDPFILCNLGLAYSGLKEYKNAEIAFTRAIEIMPNRMYSKYLLAKMYDESGDFVKAEEMCKEILTMPVKVESTATLEMKSEMRNLLETIKQLNHET